MKISRLSNTVPFAFLLAGTPLLLAAFQVGYESSSQFNREYSRLFGAPPLRDITSSRQLAASERV
jgi:AraC-like DNA-binding protein